jgi:phage gp45-like
VIRGIIQQVIEGVIKRFSATGRPGETIADREYFQHYGFTSRPKPGAEIIIIREGNHITAIASDDRRYRIVLEEGEVALYTDEGDKVHLKRDRKIEVVGGEEVSIDTKAAVVTASTSCQVDSPLINLGGNRGGLRYLCDERLIAWLQNHTHGGGPVPGQALTVEEACTTKTKAG